MKRQRSLFRFSRTLRYTWIVPRLRYHAPTVYGREMYAYPSILSNLSPGSGTVFVPSAQTHLFTSVCCHPSMAAQAEQSYAAARSERSDGNYRIPIPGAPSTPPRRVQTDCAHRNTGRITKTICHNKNAQKIGMPKAYDLLNTITDFVH